MHITTHLAVVWLAFAPSKLTQLNASSFFCNLFSPSAVSPLQMTTSARPFPFLPRSPLPFRLASFASVRSFRLSAPVSRRFLFLPLRSVPLFAPLAPLPDTQLPVLPFSPPSVPPPSGFPNALTSSFVLARSAPFFSTGFPFEFPGSAYSALLFVPVRSSLLRSHSRSTGAPTSFRFYPSIRRLVLAPVPSASTLDFSSPSASLPSV